MVEHIVAFRFHDHVPTEARDSLLEELKAFPIHFSEMVDFRLGKNESRRDDRYSHAFTVRFESMDQLVRYLDSERHEHFVAERWRPLIAQRAIVSFEY